jgi:aminoglycoside 6'-N-acetyltransferase
VTLRPVTDADRPRLFAVLDEPEVARWWRRDEWERIVTSDAVSFAVEVAHDVAVEVAVDGVTAVEGDVAAARGDIAEVQTDVAGMIQFEEESDPDYKSASIDIFLTTALHSRGLGRDAVRTLARYLIGERGHHRITMDPAVGNERAIRSYAAVGFRPVGVMRQYERVQDGTYRDALLMELIAEDFSG